MTLATVETIIREFFSQSPFPLEKIEKDFDETINTHFFHIDSSYTDDEKKNEELAQAINYLIRKQVEQVEPERSGVPAFVIDINGLYAKKIETLKNKAKVIADRAISFKRDVEMEPMSAFDRLIVHSALADIPNIKTESFGMGRDRRLRICYHPAVSAE